MFRSNKKQMIKIVQVRYDPTSDKFYLAEIIINSSHIVSMRQDDETAGFHANGKLPEGLHEAQQFSKIIFTNGKEITAVGSPDIINNKMKKVLHG